MFVKLFLLVALLLICYAFVVILLRRFVHVRAELASLRQQMARNDEKLYAEMQKLREMQEAQRSGTKPVEWVDGKVRK